MSTLPNYFLADLPPEAELTPTVITEACQTLKRNREKYLAGRPTQSLIRLLADVAESWLQPGYPFRKKALELGPAATGFSSPTFTAGLDQFFQQLNVQNLQALVLQEFGHLQRMDHLTANEWEQRLERSSFVRGPELLVHITGGVIPNATLQSIVNGLLLRAAQFVKCASGTALIPRLFAHSLYEADPKLGACLEIAEWKGGQHPIESALFAEADAVTATGSDETLEKLRSVVPSQTPFVPYGHRVSFAFVAREMLIGAKAQQVIHRAAREVAAWNQLGCLSPHAVYVEVGGAVSPEQFAERLGAELDQLEQSEPRGPVWPPEESTVISTRRAFYEVRAAGSDETRMWFSRGSTAWTVIYETDPRFQHSCLNRFVYVKPVANLQQALQAVDAIRLHVSTVGLAAGDERLEQIANQLARWGAPRICTLGQMQNPPLTWRHDGWPALGRLVRWTDWEQ